LRRERILLCSCTQCDGKRLQFQFSIQYCRLPGRWLFLDRHPESDQLVPSRAADRDLHVHAWSGLEILRLINIGLHAFLPRG
ncbi:unnamed protein product, partial [Penicillium nalgiovense]